MTDKDRDIRLSMISDYLLAQTGIGFTVDEVDGTIIITYRDQYHCYIHPNYTMLVGSLIDKDFDTANILRNSTYAIKDIYQNNSNK